MCRHPVTCNRSGVQTAREVQCLNGKCRAWIFHVEEQTGCWMLDGLPGLPGKGCCGRHGFWKVEDARHETMALAHRCLTGAI